MFSGVRTQENLCEDWVRSSFGKQTLNPRAVAFQNAFNARGIESTIAHTVMQNTAQNLTPQTILVTGGTGRGYSVLEMIKAFEAASGKPVPYDIVARRPGDIAACYAEPSLAKRLLGWEAKYDIERMCADAWRWQLMNPLGFVPSENKPAKRH